MPAGTSPTELVRAPAFAPPRLSRDVARALDRLARRAHAFHRFAHHPLCERYAGELIRLGRRERVCRGCAALASGLCVGAALAVLAAPSAATLNAALAAGAALGAVSLRLRLPKIIGRFLPAVALGAGLASVVTAFESYAWLSGSVGCMVVVLLYRRRGPSRTPCESCPERTLPAPCSGFARIVRRERAFQRVAQKLIERA
jgi:hypothetical protein